MRSGDKSSDIDSKLKARLKNSLNDNANKFFKRDILIKPYDADKVKSLHGKNRVGIEIASSQRSVDLSLESGERRDDVHSLIPTSLNTTSLNNNRSFANLPGGLQKKKTVIQKRRDVLKALTSMDANPGILEADTNHADDHFDEFGRTKRYKRLQEIDDTEEIVKGVCCKRTETKVVSELDSLNDPEQNVQLEAMEDELYELLA